MLTFFKLSIKDAPAAAEAAVEAGVAVVEAACMQQYAAAAVWVLQGAACVAGYAGNGRRGHNHNGWHAASVHAAVGSECGVQRSGVCAVMWNGSCTFV